MTVYDRLGVRRVINAEATLTKLGGSRMSSEVLAAMADAARSFVALDELQRSVGARLAELTRNEAAYVSCGAAAGIALAVAACMAEDDPAAIRQLPDTTGLKNEVIVHRTQRNGYDHAVRQTGATLVEIGMSTGTQAWELEAAIGPRTAAIIWFQFVGTGHCDLPLATVLKIAAARNIPVLVDAAAQLPPVENLWRYTEAGAALAIFSGGKDLCGPQSSGLVVGQKRLIDWMRVNGNPNPSLGRSMKVGKEEMVGLLVAVERYLAMDHQARAERDERVVASWIAAMSQLPGLRLERSFPNEAGQPLPRLKCTIAPKVAGIDRDTLVARLWDSDPRIAVGRGGDDAILLNPMTLSDDDTGLVLQALVAVLSEARRKRRAS